MSTELDRIKKRCAELEVENQKALDLLEKLTELNKAALEGNARTMAKLEESTGKLSHYIVWSKAMQTAGVEQYLHILKLERLLGWR